MPNIISFFTKQAALMRGSTVLSLPFQLVFLAVSSLDEANGQGIVNIKKVYNVFDCFGNHVNV
jgi:hypothetical protein